MKFTDKVWGATLVSYNVGSSEWFVVNQKVRHCAVPATVKFVVVLYMRTLQCGWMKKVTPKETYSAVPQCARLLCNLPSYWVKCVKRSLFRKQLSTISGSPFSPRHSFKTDGLLNKQKRCLNI